MGRARDLANILSSSGNVALDSELGLSLITPTSIANTGGSASISSTGAVSFTSASAISLNGCFTSTYTNYQIILNVKGSGTLGLSLRLRSSGTDSSTSYYRNGIYAIFSSATLNGVNSNNANEYSFGNVRNSEDSSYIFDFLKPYVLDRTVMTCRGSGANYWDIGVAFHDLTNVAYDGFTIYPPSGNITGTVSVYGYRK
jgi:hypothetical protein